MLLYVGANFNAGGGGLSNPQLQDGSLPDRDSICVAVDDHGRQLVGFCEQKGLVLCTGRAPGAVTGTLAALFSGAFAAGSIPDSWTTSAITPIYEKEDPTATSNYRPI